MILVLAGTRDGRELAHGLSVVGHKVLLSVVSDYARVLVSEASLEVRVGALDKEGMIRLLQEAKIKMVVDASHPYAVEASLNALGACATVGKPYVRYERPRTEAAPSKLIIRALSVEEAARAAAGAGKTVFLTTGSRSLAIFKNEPLLATHRLIARVLPEPNIVEQCRRIGFLPRDIVALEGPFTHELNKALFAHYRADVIVTKDSGETGGADTKLSAAEELGIKAVMIERPVLPYGTVLNSPNAVEEFVNEMSGLRRD